MSGWDDRGLPPPDPAEPAPGLDGVPRADLALVEGALPRLVDLAQRGPLVLTRHGREAFVVVPIDIWRRLYLTGHDAKVVEATPVPTPRGE